MDARAKTLRPDEDHDHLGDVTDMVGEIMDKTKGVVPGIEWGKD